MTISEIKKDISRRLNRAATKTHADGIRIIEDSFHTFYAQGNPTRPRTGTLPGAAYNPDPIITATSASMEIGYEGDQISYSDGTFTGGEVLGATMTGTYGVLGDPIYDELAFEEIIEAADRNFAAEFK